MATPPRALPSFKCILVGDGGVGKTSFVKRLLTGEVEKRYIPTLGVDVYPPLLFQTNLGQLHFNCWDCGGQAKFAELGYYIEAKWAIILFSVYSKNTYLLRSAHFRAVTFASLWRVWGAGSRWQRAAAGQRC